MMNAVLFDDLFSACFKRDMPHDDANVVVCGSAGIANKLQFVRLYRFLLCVRPKSLKPAMQPRDMTTAFLSAVKFI